MRLLLSENAISIQGCWAIPKQFSVTPIYLAKQAMLREVLAKQAQTLNQAKNH